MRALSYTFIWQPQVITCRRLGGTGFIAGTPHSSSTGPAGRVRQAAEQSASA